MAKSIITALLSSILTFCLTCYLFMTVYTFEIGGSIEFQSDDGKFEFVCIPSKGRDYKMMNRAFENYKKQSNLGNEVKLIRVTRKNYLNISKWCAYKGKPEWQYPTR